LGHRVYYMFVGPCSSLFTGMLATITSKHLNNYTHNTIQSITIQKKRKKKKLCQWHARCAQGDAKRKPITT